MSVTVAASHETRCLCHVSTANLSTKRECRVCVGHAPFSKFALPSPSISNTSAHTNGQGSGLAPRDWSRPAQGLTDPSKIRRRVPAGLGPSTHRLGLAACDVLAHSQHDFNSRTGTPMLLCSIQTDPLIITARPPTRLLVVVPLPIPWQALIEQRLLGTLPHGRAECCRVQRLDEVAEALEDLFP